MAAAANPIFALKELGFELSEEVARDIEERAIYSRAQLARRRTLLAKLREHGLEFDSPHEVLDESLVRDQIKRKLRLPAKCLPRSLTVRRAGLEAQAAARRSKPRELSFRTKVADPLAGLAREHPAMPALIELRELEASVRRLGSPALYDAIRSGEVKLPVSKMTIRPSRGPIDADG